MVTLRPHRRMTHEVGTVADLVGLRDRLRAWLQDGAVAESAGEDLLLVATELCANAIEAGETGAPVEVEVANDGTALRLTVANESGDLPLPAPPAFERGSLQERGRGLAIVRALVDTFSVSTAEGRTVVRTVQLL